MFSIETLKNYSTLITIPHTDVESVTVLVLFPVGSRYETHSMNGVSHFLEHMLFKGTKRRPSTVALTRILDHHGAEYNAYTSKEITAYYIKIDKEHLELASDLLEDMLFHSLLEEKEFNREKGVIVQELNMYEDTPTRDVAEEFELLLFDGSPLSWKIGGTPEIIRALKYDALRSYYQKHYIPSRMVVAAAGAIDEKGKQILRSIFGRGKAAKSRASAFRPAVSLRNKQKVRLKYKETDQVHVSIGFPALSYSDSDMPALNVITTVLGGMMTSRLFLEVRERRGLAYVVRANEESYRDAGTLFVHAGLEKDKIDQAIRVILREVYKVSKNGLTQKEIAVAQSNIRGRMALSLEDTSSLASFYGMQYVMEGRVKTIEERLDLVDRVTAEDVLRVARHIIQPRHLRTAIIGPFKDGKHFEQLVSKI